MGKLSIFFSILNIYILKQKKKIAFAWHKYIFHIRRNKKIYQYTKVKNMNVTKCCQQKKAIFNLNEGYIQSLLVAIRKST